MSLGRSTLVFLLPPSRDAQILSLEPQVRVHAARIFRRVPSSVGFDALLSAGWTGAVTAVDRFRPDAGASLSTFADRHVRGAILDYLRSLDDLTRDHRRKLVAEGAELPETISLDVEVRSKNWQTVPLLGLFADDGGAGRQAALEARIDVEELMRRANLSPRTEAIIREHFLGERLMREVASRWGINESRVSQICKDGLAKLRNAA